jgi:hypothetical protein
MTFGGLSATRVHLKNSLPLYRASKVSKVFRVLGDSKASKVKLGLRASKVSKVFKASKVKLDLRVR